VAGLLVLLVAAGSLLWSQRGDEAVLPSAPPGAGTGTPTAEDGADRRADAAAALLGRLVTALEHGTPAQLAALAAPGDEEAAGELRALRANVRRLRIRDLSMRYVDEGTGEPSPDPRRRLRGRTWIGDVAMRWRLAGFDVGTSDLEVGLTFVETPGGAAFASARDDQTGATPLWMLGPVAVHRTPQTVVETAGSVRPARFSPTAAQAVRDVRKVLPAWRGRLVVEVPADEKQLGRVLGSQDGAYGGIAAVTTTADGSTSEHAPVHIFVNPRVFDPLGPRGAQIVLSHEATHVATGAATSSMPTWLLEGFADFVALDHADLPVSVTASQILAQVRRSGPPTHLPGSAEFDPRNKALGASYEAAWLACRLLADRYGERRLIRFYRAADEAGSTTVPFRSLLGTDQRAFTRAWRSYLRRLAG
jgi:hypothetical protein